MKPRRMLYVILSILMFHMMMDVKAQERGGCDLCGPDAGNNQNVANGNYSATIGVSCEANGSYSFASGFYAKANAASTVAIGKYVRARTTNSMVIGSGSSDSDARALINNIPNSLMVGFNSSVPTLFVSSSSGFNTTGKIGIGRVTSPQSKLHIKSDANEDAGIILEPTSSTNKAYFQIYDTKHKITVDKDKGMTFISQDDKMNLDANVILMNSNDMAMSALDMNAKIANVALETDDLFVSSDVLAIDARNLTLASGNIDMNAKVSINTSNRFADGYEYALAVDGGILTTEVLVKEVTEWYDWVFDDNYKLISISELEKYINANGHLPDLPSEKEIVEKGYNMVEMDGLLLKKIEELTLYTIELNKLIVRQQEIINNLQSK